MRSRLCSLTKSLEGLGQIIQSKKSINPLKHCSVRSCSTLSGPHHIWVSTSHNIFSNLALEDWLYTNVNFDQRELLLLWYNEPCIVIGRHQNPWTECNNSAAIFKQVDIARRNSGGGTVYHDKGNLCCSFFTTRKTYDRKKNLNFIVRTLRKNFDLDVGLSDRDDIILDNQFKISGTAAKLGRQVAYHHCTILISVATGKLKKLLLSPMEGICSRATESVRSEVKNVSECNSSVTVDSMIAALMREYHQYSENKAEQKQVDPTNELQFPGIHSLTTRLTSWDWIYGKTPPFSIQKSFSRLIQGSKVTVTLKLTIEKGLLKDIEMHTDVPVEGEEMVRSLIGELQGKQFCFSTLDGSMREATHRVDGAADGENVAWVWKCFREIFQ